MRLVLKPLLVAGAAALVVTAAGTEDLTSARGSASATTSAPQDGATTQPAEFDGVLTIGVLLPQTGEGSTIGLPGITAVELAVAAINEEGVFEEPVRLVKADEGATVEEARAAVEALLSQDVDAVVGPASSLVALEVLDDLMNAGVVTCSPAATSIALDNYPNRELFFRSVPSDSLAADALAAHAKRTGVTTATVVYLDDAFGRPFAREVMSALDARDIRLVNEVPLGPGDSDYSDEALQLASAEATGTILLIADSEHGWAMLTDLAEVFPNPPRIIVNDALRRPPSVEIVTSLPNLFRVAIDGYSPMAMPESAGEPEGPYATHSYNCVNLIALASVAAGTDDPADIASELRSVANDGAECATFAECVPGIEQGLDVNYNGPGGLLLEIDADGDPSRARFQLFQFDVDGFDVGTGSGTQSD